MGERDTRFDYFRVIQPGEFNAEELPTAQLIQRRRLQLLVHSRLYYSLDTNLISDGMFDNFSNELVQLQKAHPEIAARIVFAKAFEDWDGSTGAFLPLTDPWVVFKAEQLLNISRGGSKNEHKKVQQVTGVVSSKSPKGKTATKQRGNSLF